MNNIIYDDEIITPKDNIYKYEYYRSFIERLDKRSCVKLGLFCAKIVNPNTKETNHCITLVEKWLIDENSVTRQELYSAANSANSAIVNYHTTNDYPITNNTYDIIWPIATAYYAVNAADAATADYAAHAINCARTTTYSTQTVYYTIKTNANTHYITNKYLQILLRKTKQFQNNKILEQISKTDVDKLELVDWNMITDIMQEEYNITHEFEYNDIFSRRCLIELLRKEYT